MKKGQPVGNQESPLPHCPVCLCKGEALAIKKRKGAIGFEFNFLKLPLFF
jgi:hypothetical protein